MQNLQQELIGCGFKPEKRPYSPHVTLARKARFVDAYRLDEPLEWGVSEFVLVTSHGGRAPPHYEVVKKWDMDS
nr:2'-5' RNA ligase family protein [Solemya velesiana gill symbiont]